MKGLLARAAFRHHSRHPWQSGLSVLGVALGVAVVVSIDLATGSARQAFRVSAETVAGRATHQVTGGPAGVPDSVVPLLRIRAGVHRSAPVLEEWVASPRLPGRALRLLGVDPFSESAVRPYLAGGDDGRRTGGPTAGPGGSGEAPDGPLPMARLVTRPRAVFLEASTAREAGLGSGDPLPVEVGGGTDTLRVAGLLEPKGELARRGMRNLLVMDVAAAQALTGRTGELSRVDLVLPGGTAGERAVAKVRRMLPPGLRLQETGTRTRTMVGMTRAFDLNLEALSLLALLFGVFLIYNTVTFSVVQRRQLLGALRALGLTRAEVFATVLLEAVALGVVGSALGLGLGVLLGRGLVRLVARTINDLYFTVSVEGVTLAPAVLVKGAVLGVVATAVASLPAVLEATAVPPRATLTRSYVEERVRALVPRAAWLGVAVAALGAGLLLVPSRSIVLGFVALFGLLLGAALLAPLATVWLVRLLLPLVRRVAGVLGTMAARGVSAALSRTAPAAAALVVAVAVTVGLGAMISSFRAEVASWLAVTLQGDVYVSAPGTGASRPRRPLDPALVERVAELPGVAGVTRFRSVGMETAYGRIGVVGVAPAAARPVGLHVTEGDPEAARTALRQGEAVLVSGSFAYRNRVGPGSTIGLETDAGRRSLTVRGVYRDYGSDQGEIMMGLELYRRLWDDPAVSSLAVYADPGTSPDALVGRIEAAAAPGGGIVATSSRDLRRRSLEVFDQTFAITRVLRLLATVVAFIAILSALMALQLERGRELGVLRANGLTPAQVWHLVTAQTGVLGAAAGLLALPAGVVLALVMVHVVDRRSFGWAVDLHLGWRLPLETMALAVFGALLAGLYPAWRMSRTPPARALREE